MSKVILVLVTVGLKLKNIENSMCATYMPASSGRIWIWIQLLKMKNDKNYLGFLIPKIGMANFEAASQP